MIDARSWSDADRARGILLPSLSLMRTACLLLVLVMLASGVWAQTPCDGGGMVLRRAARVKNTDPPPRRGTREWQFLDAVGPHAGLLGSEDGTFEAWVYPLKLLRNFQLQIRVGDTVLDGTALPRTITVRPESASVEYKHDSVHVCATWFVPLDQQGAVVEIEVDSKVPASLQGSFVTDVAWMWPAEMVGGYSQWDPKSSVYRFSNDAGSLFGVAGAAGLTAANPDVGRSSTGESQTFSFGPAATGRKVYRFVMTASFENQKQAEELYAKLLADDGGLMQQARQHYAKYLDNTVQLQLPDKKLQMAYDWARISTVQGLVDEPFAGNGLVAGYNISSGTHRPGFSWYFGRDSMWTALALDSIGDFATTRTALEFLMQYQRPDGRIPHEIAQSVKLVDWWKDYPYGTASADGTPLFLVGFADYVRASGDVSFAREHWESVWRAYQFLKTTYAANGLSQNLNIGHGWIEGGPLRPQADELRVPHDPPLVPIAGEFYQAGVGIAGVESLAQLARAVGKNDVAQQLEAEAQTQRATMENVFWSPEKNYFVFAVDLQGKQVQKPSVLGTVPMWFGLTDAKKSDLFLNAIAAPEHQTDWGPRIISNRDPLYGATGYHYGSVWPLFTGWAAVAGYRYHRVHYGYENLMANAQLAYDGSPGRTTEVLSGDFYLQLSTSTPHQIWSSAMVISPILRGMMGLEVNALANTLTFAPHVPGGWNEFAIRNVKVGTASVDLQYRRTGEEISLEVMKHGGSAVELTFAPAVSLRAKVGGAEINGAKAEAKVASNDSDQHPTVTVPLQAEKTTIKLRVSGNFGIGYAYEAPADGAQSSGLKFVSREWNAGHDRLVLQLAGIAGKAYRLPLYNGAAVLAVQGAIRKQTPTGTVLEVSFPAGAANTYVNQTVTLRFGRP